ncbi:MAG: sel1 repeat family protein [Gammaproteobacteria bacterium]|nr:sel1 repeat family protein [Gammaproteobacteria bacterium]
MCKKNHHYYYMLTLLLPLILNPVNVIAATDDFGVRIFKLQERLAKKGNHLAQFKLGTLYEQGVGVEADIDEALDWYQKSANQGYTLAKDRIIYLEIKHVGFDNKKHELWISQIQKKADLLESESVLILGQLHHYGLGVKRDLDKALALLNRASSEGHTEIYSEIAALNAEIQARDKKYPKKNPERPSPYALNR